MEDPTDYKRELAAIQIILAASAQRQPAVTSLATLSTVIRRHWRWWRACAPQEQFPAGRYPACSAAARLGNATRFLADAVS